MKIAWFLMISMIGVALAYPVTIAEDEDDVRGFLEKHARDTAVLFLVNQESQENSGFWATIFNLFGSASESDESYLNSIAENNPVLKIDVGKKSLEHSSDDYKVESLPLAIAFHHGNEILRERPTSQTAERIDSKIKSIEEKALQEINHASTVHPERDSSQVNIWENNTASDVHHHSVPLIVIPDFGHLTINDPSESSLIKSRPIELLDVATGANLVSPIKINQDGDMLIDYKQKQAPRAEDPKATVPVATQPRLKPTDGRRDVPVAQSAPRQAGGSAVSRQPASAPASRSAPTRGPTVKISNGSYPVSGGAVQRMMSPTSRRR